MNSQSTKGILLADEKGYTHNEHGHIIGPSGNVRNLRSHDGYLEFNVKVPKSRKNIGVMAHRFIAYKKYGNKMFEKDIVCRHLDGNPSNNRPENIAIGTQHQNMMDRPEKDRLNHAYRASSFLRILSDEEERELLEYHATHRSYKATMEKYGISSKGTLHYILHKKRSVGETVNAVGLNPAVQ